jgi:hypothetical protein
MGISRNLNLDFFRESPKGEVRRSTSVNKR